MGTRPSALILGGARCLHDDVAAARALFSPDLLIATNNAGRDWPEPIDHWVSFHGEKLAGWIEARRVAGLQPAGRIWTAMHRRPVVGLQTSVAPNWGGSSGLLAVTVALVELGCERVVLAGVPLDKRQAHFDDTKPWTEASKYRTAWMKHLPEMRDRVRSMSGWTAEKLGTVTAEWLGSATAR